MKKRAFLLLICILALSVCLFTACEKGEKGDTGKSAYELATEKGYTGTLDEWLASLVGTNGVNGKSAYELATEKGYTGTLDEWLASLVGKDGTNGNTPQIKIGEDDYWYVSYDGGTTWQSLNIKANVKHETEGSEGLEYYPLSDGTYGVKMGRAIYLNKIVIPATYNGKSVTQILYQELDEVMPNVLSVTIPESIEAIAEAAFEEWGIVEVINKSSLDITLGSYDTHGAVAGDALTVHGGDSKIKNQNGFLFLDNNGEIYLLGYSGRETDLVLPETYNNQSYQIRSGAFANNGSIKSIVIPKTVKSVKNSTFYGCVGLTTVYYTGDLASWCEIEFGYWYANPLEYATHLYIDNKPVKGELVIPDSTTRIGYSAFKGLTGITSVIIGDGVESIGSYAFEGCTGITSVTIGNGVESIGSYAFEGCTGITSVTIGSGVESIGSFAFNDCTGITEINFNATNCTDLSSSYNYAFAHAGTNTNGITVTFGDNVKHIPAYLFHPTYSSTDAPNIKTVIIGDGVESIGSYAFDSCTGITEIKYCGTETQWEAISKGTYWISNTGCTITYNYTDE